MSTNIPNTPAAPHYNRLTTRFLPEEKTICLLTPFSNLFGRTVTLYKSPGANDYTEFSVRQNKRTAKDWALFFLECFSGLLPVLLIIKAASKENKNLANKIATLKEIPEPVVNTVGKVSEQAGSLHPSKEQELKASGQTQLQGDQTQVNTPVQQPENTGWFSWLSPKTPPPLDDKEFVKVSGNDSKLDAPGATGQ